MKTKSEWIIDYIYVLQHLQKKARWIDLQKVRRGIFGESKDKKQRHRDNVRVHRITDVLEHRGIVVSTIRKEYHPRINKGIDRFKIERKYVRLGKRGTKNGS